MLRICTITSAEAAKSYFTDPSRADYYTGGLEKPGLWGGKGAEMLGLRGTVNHGDFQFLCDNRQPKSRKEWTARQRANRRVGYDFNFHAPKSVSVMHALTGDDQIRLAFEGAVRETMEHLEQDMQTRIRRKVDLGDQDDADRNTGNMLWAEFTHWSTRPTEDSQGDVLPDPHLHVHAVAFNGTWDPVEKKWKAGQFGRIKKDARFFEACFHSRLVERIQKLGYEIETTASGWELKGIDLEVCKKFSNRSTEIDHAAKERDLTRAEKVELGKRTRRKKDEGEQLSHFDLRRRWTNRLTTEEISAVRRAYIKAQNRPKANAASYAQADAEQSVAYAVDHVFERKSVTSEREILGEAIRAGLGKTNISSVEKSFCEAPVLRYDEGGQHWITTEEVLEEERRFINFCREGHQACPVLHPSGDAAITDELSQQQNWAMLHVLNSKDRVTAIRGRAGTGKTTMMTATIDALEKAGHRVFTFAPTSDAVENTLKKEGFQNAQTIQTLLVDPRKQKEAAGSVLWIDEAGLLSAKQMATIADLAEEHNYRIILAGDTGQHSAVERGDALRILEAHGGLKPVELYQIYRQKDPVYNEAVRLLSNGQVDEAFERLETLSAIQETPTKDRFSLMAADYVESVSKGKTALCVSPTHREGAAVTQQIRDTLRDLGKLSGQTREYSRLVSSNMTEAERSRAANYAPGMVIQTHRRMGSLKKDFRAEVVECNEDRVMIKDANGTVRQLDLLKAGAFNVFEQKKLEVQVGDRIRVSRNGKTTKGKPIENGTIHTVKDIRLNGALVLQNGESLAPDFGHLAHGYCITSHVSQGKTVDEVFIAESSDSFPAASLEQFYVSASRGRDRLRIYTDDKDALKRAVKRSCARRSASDFMEDPREMIATKDLGWIRRLNDVARKWARQIIDRESPKLTPSSDRGMEIPVQQGPISFDR